MTGRRLISGLAGAWAIASPGATRVRLEGAAGAPRRLVASWLAALLGRAQLPGMGELAALRPDAGSPCRLFRVDRPGSVGHPGSRGFGRNVCSQHA